MSSAAAFQATYSDWKLIRSRKVVQVVLEIPLEASGQAYDVLGGMPNPGAETWCAVARLSRKEERPNPLTDPQPASAAAPTVTNAPTRARRQVPGEKRLAQQAGMCCADPVFQTFLYEHDMLNVTRRDDPDEAETAAAIAVRMICGVQSRKDITLGTPAGDAWDNLLSKFMAWKLAA